ncbi:hypothetical protein CsSME_00024644 [Camellia sinensis var. sinensis]
MSGLFVILIFLSQWKPSIKSQVELVVINCLLEVCCTVEWMTAKKCNLFWVLLRARRSSRQAHRMGPQRNPLLTSIRWLNTVKSLVAVGKKFWGVLGNRYLHHCVKNHVMHANIQI